MRFRYNTNQTIRGRGPKSFGHDNAPSLGRGEGRGGGRRGGGMSGEARGESRGGARGNSDQSGMRRRRLFDGAALRLMLLSLIEAQPRHGYELIRAIEERSGGGYVPSPGMVYPLLTMIAEMGLVSETADGGTRKSLALTAVGTTLLDTQRDAIDALFKRLDALAEVAERTDAQPVRRAMHNLRSVLMTRLAQDNVSNDTIFDAVALIDSAAQQIERL